MSKTIGIRVDEELEEQLEELSQSMRLKKSQLIKRAFTEWYRTREGIQGQNMMLIDSVLVAALFKILDRNEIKEIADSISDHIVSMITIRQIESRRKDETPEDFLAHFSNIISSQHFGWFTNINYSTDKDGVISVYGFHTLNTQYSQYAVEMLSQILHKMFNYNLIEDEVTTTDNSLIFMMKPPSEN